MRSTFAAFLALTLLLLATAGVATAKKNSLDVIPLPNGWAPEGIASGPGNDLYVGSIPTGGVLRVDAKTGRTAQVVPAQDGRSAIGIKVDGGRIYVSGGATGRLFVYD